MNMDEYQHLAYQTAKYPRSMLIVYPALGMAGECGEVCNKVKKIYRDDNGLLSPGRKAMIEEEMGAVMWYLAALATDLGVKLGDVAWSNIKILQGREKRGTISGDGDQR